MDIANLTATELAGLYRTKTLSPVEVAKDHIARRDSFEPQINAFIVKFTDEALAEAKHSESRWQMGEPLSPLDGVPITIKDNLVVKGVPCRRGSAVSPDKIETEDSPVVARLREAGTILLGKTTMPLASAKRSLRGNSGESSGLPVSGHCASTALSSTRAACPSPGRRAIARVVMPNETCPSEANFARSSGVASR